MELKTEGISTVVIGTAGHVDHGKTALVEALTGTKTDRWQEERDRGITIDIGFASRELPDGRRVGFIDVPGHERFVRHMIAGAAGVDVALLVVSCDDGVMPQTREHLDIMGLLGVRDGVVAVTKIDIDRDLAELAVEEVSDFLKGTFLDGAPVVCVSSVTGEGVDELWQALVDGTTRARERPADGLFRMPVQRAFTLQGFGTVLTGVPVSGTARAGDLVEVLPGGGKGRIRSVQAYFREVETARAGHSTGLNVADLDVSRCRRGQVAVPKGTFEPSRLVDARLVLLPSAGKPLRAGSPVRFHTGTAEVAAKVTVLDRESVGPGGDALVQLRLEEPVVFARLDRFIVRRASPAVTIGGGTIIGPGVRRLRANRPWVAGAVSRREEASKRDDTFVEHIVESAPGGAVREDVLVRRSLLPPGRAAEIVNDLVMSGTLRRFGPGPTCAHSATVSRLRARLGEMLLGLHESEPDLPGMAVTRAASELGVDRRFLEFLVQPRGEADEGGTFARERDCVRLASHRARLAAEDQALAAELESACRSGGYKPPDVGGMAKRLGVKEARVLRVCAFLVHEGVLVEAAKELFFHAQAVARAREFVLRALGEKGELDTGEFKAFLMSAGGTSRKYLVPLLEHFDRTGLTRREGDTRRPGHVG